MDEICEWEGVGAYGGYGVIALAEGLESVSAPHALGGAVLCRGYACIYLSLYR